jgi:hypothetical protein
MNLARLVSVFLAIALGAACGGSTTAVPGGDGGASGPDGAPTSGGDDAAPPPLLDASPPPPLDAQPPLPDASLPPPLDASPPQPFDAQLPPPTPTSKLDVLFMIDNSASMGDKQALLRAAVPDMIARLVTPNCVDANGNRLGISQNGQCAQGQIEFKPVEDLHIGIVSSSLGGRGSDQCSSTSTSPANPNLNAHNDDRGHLLNRAGADEHVIADAAPSNFLAWFPPVSANAGQPPPPVAALGDAAKLVADFQDMVAGVHEHGCGFEAQLESWYRFLVQPDPFDTVALSNAQASLVGVDAILLQQRHDFLRPDSAVAVVVISDENEEIVDPMLLGGQAWAFLNLPFPGSPNGAAPEGTVECATNPLDPNCTSCAFVQSRPDFPTRCPKDGATGLNGYLDPTDDNLNIRSFHTRQRFGVVTQDPISRYVLGLSSYAVPDRNHEHDASGNYIGDSIANMNCVNPLFAQNLPTDPNADLCRLAAGPRTPSQVFFAVIGGVPHQLLQTDPSSPDSPPKKALTEVDWTKILGKDPLNYDFTGADFHMLESTDPRAGSQCPPTAADNCDPINGREWDTKKQDLQFACIFDLAEPKDCTQPQYFGACDCAQGALNSNTPLCQRDATGQYTQIQVRGKAYPSIRELSVARALGARSVVASICPIHTAEAVPGDPLYGYRPAIQSLVDRLASTLQK